MKRLKKIEEKDITNIHEKWIDTNNREIWIHGIDKLNDSDYDGEEPGVEYMMATRVIKNLHILRRQSETERVTVHLHTCGGVDTEGFAIYDAIMMMPYPTTIINYTHARSMSSIIFQAGSTRVMLPSSYFMIHLGKMFVGGNAKEVYTNIEFNRHSDKRMLDIYVNKTKHSNKFRGMKDDEIKGYLVDQMDKKSDVFLTADEAVEWGFADYVLREKWPSKIESLSHYTKEDKR
jgi:ATP-dependent protease ClpP protease subunit